MAVKNVNLPYQIMSSATMVAQNTLTSSASNIMYHDSVAVSFAWSGNPTGTFQIQGSLDYNPGTPQSGGQANSGTWNNLTLSPQPTAGSGSATYLVNMNQLAFPWLRIQYTNSTGSGVLSACICSKSLGS